LPFVPVLLILLFVLTSWRADAVAAEHPAA